MADPIQPDLIEIMNNIAKLLSKIFKPYGFSLLVFPFAQNDKGNGRMNYISNANREDMLAAMKEFIANAEGRLQHHTTKQ